MTLPQESKSGDVKLEAKGESKAVESVLTIPPPKKLSDVKREQELKLQQQQQGSTAQPGPLNDNSSNNQSYART